mgnify:CR=1 FL=1
MRGLVGPRTHAYSRSAWLSCPPVRSSSACSSGSPPPPAAATSSARPCFSAATPKPPAPPKGLKLKPGKLPLVTVKQSSNQRAIVPAQRVRYLAEIAEAESSLRQGEQQLTGWLRVAASVGFGRLKLLPLVKSFLAAHPAVKIDLRLNDGFIDLVEQGIGFGEIEDCVAHRAGGVVERTFLQRRVVAGRREPEEQRAVDIVAVDGRRKRTAKTCVAHQVAPDRIGGGEVREERDLRSFGDGIELHLEAAAGSGDADVRRGPFCRLWRRRCAGCAGVR